MYSIHKSSSCCLDCSKVSRQRGLFQRGRDFSCLPPQGLIPFREAHKFLIEVVTVRGHALVSELDTGAVEHAHVEVVSHGPDLELRSSALVIVLGAGCSSDCGNVWAIMYNRYLSGATKALRKVRTAFACLRKLLRWRRACTARPCQGACGRRADKVLWARNHEMVDTHTLYPKQYFRMTLCSSCCRCSSADAS